MLSQRSRDIYESLVTHVMRVGLLLAVLCGFVSLVECSDRSPPCHGCGVGTIKSDSGCVDCNADHGGMYAFTIKNEDKEIPDCTDGCDVCPIGQYHSGLGHDGDQQRDTRTGFICTPCLNHYFMDYSWGCGKVKNCSELFL